MQWRHAQAIHSLAKPIRVSTWHMQVLDALVGLGMRTQVTPGMLLAAAHALNGVPDPAEGNGVHDWSEDDVSRAARLLAKLDEAATQGVRLFALCTDVQ